MWVDWVQWHTGPWIADHKIQQATRGRVQTKAGVSNTGEDHRWRGTDRELSQSGACEGSMRQEISIK